MSQPYTCTAVALFGQTPGNCLVPKEAFRPEWSTSIRWRNEVSLAYLKLTPASQPLPGHYPLQLGTPLPDLDAQVLLLSRIEWPPKCSTRLRGRSIVEATGRCFNDSGLRFKRGVGPTLPDRLSLGDAFRNVRYQHGNPCSAGTQALALPPVAA